MKPTLIAIPLLALLALLPATSSAAVVSVSASSGPAAEDFIDYQASKGEANNLVVKKSGRFLFFTDTGAKTLVAKRDKVFSDCVKTAAKTARCESGTVIMRLGDGNDRVKFDYKGKGDDKIPSDPFQLADQYVDTEGGFLESAIVDAGAGDDVIGGTPFTDSISPGPGADRVNAGGGQDSVNLKSDGKRDVVKGNAGVNELSFFGSTAVTVDTRAGTAKYGSETDVIRGFRRIIGGPKNDTLRGGDAGEALYGEGGTDDIEGNGGDDYLSGDLPISSPYFPDNISGGEGDDVIDVRDRALKPTSIVDCGPGADRVASQEDDRLTACESSMFMSLSTTSTPTTFSHDGLDPGTLTAVTPVSRGADGAPTYDIPCPSGPSAQPCSGKVQLTRPPTAGGPNPDLLGEGTFTVPPGERRPVTVALNPGGVAALSSPGAVLSVHVRGTIPPPTPPPGTPSQIARQIDFGWQTTF